MPLNLISDPWIPVIDMSGARHIIASWQMADAMILRPDWPRADLNIACIELLIGLVALADPPAHAEDWEDRQTTDPARLRERLAPFAPAFDLLGEGPRFMQELGGLIGDVRAADLLFVDSGGEGSTLMVREGRYPGLDLPTAAMALYTMQTQAPSGGRGNLTSLRGGGPMTVLVDPGGGLWPLVWANVPDGTPARPEDLPWMHRTVTSEGGVAHFPHQGHPATIFFGMPRRLWLVAEEDRVTGVIQRPNGTRYTGWTHPLTPYYRQKAGDDPLPVRPRAGVFGYRHWLGVAVRSIDPVRGSVMRPRHRPRGREHWLLGWGKPACGFTPPGSRCAGPTGFSGRRGSRWTTPHGCGRCGGCISFGSGKRRPSVGPSTSCGGSRSTGARELHASRPPARGGLAQAQL